MSRLDQILNSENIPSYIAPLFWQHGEDEHILREEIRQMHENGIGGFVVESRPHPDFLGEKWWRDLDIIIDEAKKRDMKVWLFDDCAFPSGFSGGKIRDNYPEYLKIYMDERHIDALGPLAGSSFMIKSWLAEDESIIRVIAALRTDGEDKIDGESLVDLTTHVYNGVLYWDVPDGDWRIFIIVRTRNGGEEGTKYYLNPIEAKPVRAFIDYVYEEHYKRYEKEFGRTIAGFFSDEPRLGNAATYEAALGKTGMIMPYYNNYMLPKMVLPYSDTLPEQLNRLWDGDYLLYSPCLWYDGGPVTSKVRYVFMDLISNLFGENYTQQIGDWCRQHGVKYIGHVVEDNGVHARLGYGSGHFFRSIKGQDYSGLDIVYQVWPEHTSGKFSTPFGYLDADFFYWGLAKMASSAAHIDPKKNGITVCEIFGAYGWQEGLKLMKWLTDHICVRGVNFIIPHAFSPKYPDSDCPPHFYARGANPQWRYFGTWSAYANRVCHLLTGGTHVAPVAVLYHAEAEWAGKYMPFEKVVKTLAKSQIDCDVVPIDLFVEGEEVSLKDRTFFINKEEYKALIIPYSQRLPLPFVKKLLEYMDMEIQIIFIDDYPESCCEKTECIDELNRLKENSHSMVLVLGELAEQLKSSGLADIETETGDENLRGYHYVNEDKDIFFFTNESSTKPLETNVKMMAKGIPEAYDALEDKFYSVDYVNENGKVSVKIELEPYQSLFIIFNKNEWDNLHDMSKQVNFKKLSHGIGIEGPWKVYTSEAQEYPSYKEEERIKGLGNVSVPGVLPEFSGTIRYETKFEIRADNAAERLFIDLGRVYETAEVWVNGKHAGVRICPPYCIEITGMVKTGKNSLCIDVTNTLAKKHGDNPLDRAMAQEPSGLMGPVRIVY